MAYSVLSFEATPNPDALRCVLDASLPASGFGARPRAYSAPGPGPDVDALAHKLCSIPGVAHVLIHPGWLTVVRDGPTQWGGIKAAVRRVLADET